MVIKKSLAGSGEIWDLSEQPVQHVWGVVCARVALFFLSRESVQFIVLLSVVNLNDISCLIRNYFAGLTRRCEFITSLRSISFLLSQCCSGREAPPNRMEVSIWNFCLFCFAIGDLWLLRTKQEIQQIKTSKFREEVRKLKMKGFDTYFVSTVLTEFFLDDFFLWFLCL